MQICSCFFFFSKIRWIGLPLKVHTFSVTQYQFFCTNTKTNVDYLFCYFFHQLLIIFFIQEYHDLNQLTTDMEAGYRQNALNCWIAALLYLVTLCASVQQFWMNNRSSNMLVCVFFSLKFFIKIILNIIKNGETSNQCFGSGSLLSGSDFLS